MRFNNYIIASLLSHILFFGIFAMLLRGINTDMPVLPYSVNIVGPLEEKKEPPRPAEKIFRRPPAVVRKPAPEKLLDDTPPKTLYGEGTDSRQSEAMKNAAKTADGQESSEQSAGLQQDSDRTPSQEKEILPEGEKGLAQRPNLFDKETINQYAQNNAAYGKEEKKGLTFDAPELKHRGYMRKLKEKIESVWKYPEEAARRGISGDLYISFSIHRNGRIGEVKLVRTSGHSFLDTAAMKALEDAAPYWPLPDDVKEEALTITGHFIYIYGTPFIM